eukprot:TRINITY_DN14661_c0_g1_i1.p1 TRINITY_DN14661_c0_g1~~TRINITY_DN14661_c0_g1_i1.p1  ORF type:complete len:352 (-),score=35.63 TRINITY_DN14661_c0_g1_i1:163-1080(-)
MVYFALSQTMPFSGSTMASVYKKTAKCNVSFVSGAFRACSPALHNFLKNTIKREPSQRLSASMALESDWLHVKANVEVTTTPHRDTTTTEPTVPAQIHGKTSEGVHSKANVRPQNGYTYSTVDTLEAEDACESVNALVSETGNGGANDALALAEAHNDERRVFVEALADASFMMTPTEDTGLPIIPAMASEAPSMLSADSAPISRHLFDPKTGKVGHVQSSNTNVTDLTPRAPSSSRPLVAMPACITKRSAFWLEKMTGGKTRIAKDVPESASEVAGTKVPLEAHAPTGKPQGNQHRRWRLHERV